MLKSCKYCGRIHDSKIICTEKPKRAKKRTEQSSFRSSYQWTKKSKEIKERDSHMCQACLFKLHDIGTRQYNCKDLQVHHIIPIEEDETLKLDDDNLITLCEGHHKLAESGVIKRETLRNVLNRIPPLPPKAFWGEGRQDHTATYVKKICQK